MLKRPILITLLALLPATPLVAQQEGMSEEQLQQMMQGAMQMAACFQNLDQDKLQAMATRGKAIEQELRQLCAAGDRSTAQRKAMDFGREFTQSDEFKQLQQCGDMAQSLLDGMPDYFKGTMPEGSSDQRHVCDDLN